MVISGSSFTGASAVSFGGVAAQSFVVSSATRITAVVPVAAQSIDVSVTTPLGTASYGGLHLHARSGSGDNQLHTDDHAR